MSDSEYSDYADDSDFSSDSETTLQVRGADLFHRLVFIPVFASWTTANLSGLQARVTCVAIHSAYQQHLRSTVRRAREQALYSLTAGFSGLQPRGPNEDVDYYLRIVQQAEMLGYPGGATSRRLVETRTTCDGHSALRDGPLLGVFVPNGQGAFRLVAQAATVQYQDGVEQLELRDM